MYARSAAAGRRRHARVVPGGVPSRSARRGTAGRSTRQAAGAGKPGSSAPCLVWSVRGIQPPRWCGHPRARPRGARSAGAVHAAPAAVRGSNDGSVVPDGGTRDRRVHIGARGAAASAGRQKLRGPLSHLLLHGRRVGVKTSFRRCSEEILVVGREVDHADLPSEQLRRGQMKRIEGAQVAFLLRKITDRPVAVVSPSGAAAGCCRQGSPTWPATGRPSAASSPPGARCAWRCTDRPSARCTPRPPGP